MTTNHSFQSSDITHRCLSKIYRWGSCAPDRDLPAQYGKFLGYAVTGYGPQRSKLQTQPVATLAEAETMLTADAGAFHITGYICG